MTATRIRNGVTWTLALAWVLVMFLAGGAVQAAPVSLLNPGFELGPATNSPPTHWATTGTAVAAEKSFDAAPFGNWSMAVSPGGRAVQTTNYTITANDRYTLSFYSAQTAGSAGDINAIFLADNGGTLTPLTTLATGIAGGLKNWQPYQAKFNLSGTSFVGQKLAIGFNNTSAGGNWAGVDLVSLDATADGAPPPRSFSFVEDFNGYSGTQNNTQYQTGLPVAYGGNVPGWTRAGAGAIHAVKLTSSPDDWAAMFYLDNVITSVPMAANVPGFLYSVQFDYGTAVYAQASQATAAGDALVVDVLRGDNSVLATGTFAPGAWSHPGNSDLAANLHGFLEYAGDGSGDVRIRVRSLNSTAERFGGAIDDLTVTVAADIPEPVTAALLGMAVCGLGGYVRKRRRA